MSRVHLGAMGIDAQAFRRARVFPEGEETVAEPRFLEDVGHAQNRQQHDEDDIGVNGLVVEDKIPKARRMRKEQTDAAVREFPPVGRKQPKHFSEGQRGQGEKVAGQPEGRKTDQQGDDHGEAGAGEHADPGREAERQVKNGGGIGPDSEEARMPQRDLPRESAEQVPGGRERGPEENHDDQILVKRISGKKRNHQREDDGQRDERLAETLCRFDECSQSFFHFFYPIVFQTARSAGRLK